MVTDWRADNRTSYDLVAPGYAGLFPGGRVANASVRGALAWFAELVREAGGPVLDAGCGTGHLTRHLAALGVDVFGVDLSEGMLEIARRDHPGMRFEQGDLTRLEVPDAAVGGVLAFYSVIHVPDPEMPGVAAHLHRVLRPGGVAMLGFHVGDGYRLKTQGYGLGPTRIHLYLRPVEQVCDWLRRAGLTIEATTLIDPGEEVPGGIVIARKPPG